MSVKLAKELEMLENNENKRKKKESVFIHSQTYLGLHLEGNDMLVRNLSTVVNMCNIDITKNLVFHLSS